MGSSSVKPVKVGICGLGTVGGGTFNVLERNAEEIARRAGRGIEVAQIAARRPNPKCDTGATPITADIFDVACNPEIDVVVELIGGYTLAQDEATCVVYGMPREAVELGAAEDVLPLERIAAALLQQAARRGSGNRL